MLHLLLDLGLRCGELSGLQVEDFDLDVGQVTFYRPKVKMEQTHDLINGTLKAARAYLEGEGAPSSGPLLVGSTRSGKARPLTDRPMSTRAITKRVKQLGRSMLGIEELSAHDLRHTWATFAARSGTPLDRLMDAGGWSSPAMPMRYVEAAEIANQGINLG